jgi:hypothetical protein
VGQPEFQGKKTENYHLVTLAGIGDVSDVRVSNSRECSTYINIELHISDVNMPPM